MEVLEPSSNHGWCQPVKRPCPAKHLCNTTHGQHSVGFSKPLLMPLLHGDVEFVAAVVPVGVVTLTGMPTEPVVPARTALLVPFGDVGWQLPHPGPKPTPFATAVPNEVFAFCVFPALRFPVGLELIPIFAHEL